MNVKKLFVAALFLFLAPSQTTLGFLDLPEDMSFDDLFNSSIIDQHLNETNYEFTRQGFPPSDTVSILDDMSIKSILQENLFLRTNPLNSRDILDLPMGMLDKNYEYENWISSAELFYNMTDRSYFTRKCDSIHSYLAITQDDFLEEIRKAAKKVTLFTGTDFDFDPADAFILFKNGTVQERRLGFLFYGKKSLRSWNFSWRFPFYYLERNFWFTEEEQEAIEEKLGTLEEEEQEKFQSDHMISDKLGFGDLRFSFDFPLTSGKTFSTRVGAHITVPTAWAVARGLKGSHFKPVVGGRDTDFGDLIDYHLDELISRGTDGSAEVRQTAFDALTDLAYLAIDHTAANLLDAPLGNGRHTGIGVNFSSKTPLNIFIKQRWAENIFMKSFMSLEYLLPATETRFFRERSDSRLLRRLDLKPTIVDETKAYQDMINATMLVQACNFFIAYALLRTLLFKPAIKAIQQEQQEKEHLESRIAEREKKLEQTNEEKKLAWQKFQEQFSRAAPDVKQDYVAHADVEPPSEELLEFLKSHLLQYLQKKN